MKGYIEAVLAIAGTSDATFKACTTEPTFHPGRCAEVYVGDKKTRCVKRVKPVERPVVHEDKMSIETAILFLVEQGYTGTITRQPNIYTIETIDLGKIK